VLLHVEQYVVQYGKPPLLGLHQVAFPVRVQSVSVEQFQGEVVEQE